VKNNRQEMKITCHLAEILKSLV